MPECKWIKTSDISEEREFGDKVVGYISLSMERMRDSEKPWRAQVVRVDGKKPKEVYSNYHTSRGAAKGAVLREARIHNPYSGWPNKRPKDWWWTKEFVEGNIDDALWVAREACIANKGSYTHDIEATRARLENCIGDIKKKLRKGLQYVSKEEFKVMSQERQRLAALLWYVSKGR